MKKLNTLFAFMTIIVTTNAQFSREFPNHEQNVHQYNFPAQVLQMSEDRAAGDTLMYMPLPGIYVNPTDNAGFTITIEDIDGLPTTNVGYDPDFGMYFSTDTSLNSLGNPTSTNWYHPWETPAPAGTDSSFYWHATSWFNPAGQADNWLNFGPLTIPAIGAHLIWYDRTNPSYRDGYRVMVSTTPSSVLTFSDFNDPPIYTKTDAYPSPTYTTDTTWVMRQIDLPASYNGQIVSIAFNHNANDMDVLYLDEITLVEGTIAGCAVPAQPAAITGVTIVCPSSANIVYTVPAVVGATSYTWTIPGGWSGSSITNSITLSSGTNGGTITVTANNACGASLATVLNVTISSAPPQPGAISGPTTFCNGSNNTYSIVAIAGATSYTWTLPSGWSGNSTTNSINATASTNSGTISVTYTNACGTSPAQQLTVTAGTAPAQPGAITGVTTFCPGQTQVYTINSVAGATSYTWTMPSGWSGSSNGTSITATTGVNGGQVTVTATNSCGTSSAQTLNVSLGTAPAQPGTITGNSTICSGGAQTYSVAAVAGATSYVWTLPSGWAGASNSNSITTITSATSGTVSVSAVNDCGTSLAQNLTVTVNSVPAQPIVINGTNAVCSGISGIYSVTPVAGATSYNWTIPGGWSGSSTTSSITATANGGTGNILVTVTNACGTSPSQSLNVTVSSSAPTQPGTISGNTPVCSAATTTYSVAAVSGATSYNWTLPGGWTGTSSTNSITVTVGNSGGSIAVAAANGCGTSTATTLAINVNQSPATPAAILGATTMCAGIAQTYNVATVVGATSYTWTFPAGWSGFSVTNAITSTPGTSGNISVTANNATCSSPAQTLAVTVNTPPTQPGTIAGSATVCSGASETYAVVPVNGATSYTWTMPSGWTGTSTTETLVTTIGNTSGNVTVTASNSCGTSSAQTFAVTVNVVPAQPGTITGSILVCPTSSQTYTVASVAGATSYTWTLPSGWSGNSTTNSITTSAGVAGGTITVTANNGTCSSLAQTLTVGMDSAPAQPGAITGPTSVCAGSTQTYTTAAVAGATSYTWTLPSGWSGTSTTNSITVTVGAAGTGNLQVSATNGCGSSTAQGNLITVNALPAVPTITAVGSTLSSSAATGNQWYFNAGIITGATSQVYTATQAGFYTVTVTDANGCSSTSAQFISNVGISENELANMFTIFPNPSHDVINVTVTSSRNIEAATITNVLGKTVKVINAKNIKANDTFTIDVKDLSQGIYFLSMQVEGTVVAKKIIVE